MNTAQSTSYQTARLSKDHPAYLCIGDEQKTLEHAIYLLQKNFCLSAVLRQAQDERKTNPLVVSDCEAIVSNHAQPCSVCTNCRKVREQCHESIIWLCPEKQYVVDDLKVIFSTISYALEPNQHFYFVLQKADLLSPACANALLKSLEEPPEGYHFLLLAQRAEFILPTILSRCLIENLGSSTQPLSHPLLSFFTTTAFQDPLAFSKELDASTVNEWETLTLVDQLIIYWADEYKKNIRDNNKTKAQLAEQVIAHLKNALTQPPMPGSSKIFWKNLFLQIKEGNY